MSQTAFPSGDKVRRRLADLRFLGYVGTQFSGILIPVLIYQLTQSLTLAGLAMMIEWAPKLFFYVAGGSFITHYGRRRMHFLLDAVRMASLLVLLLAAFGHGNVWTIAIAAALYQCSNALSNILFEVAATHWWGRHGAQGHATMMKSDQFGCLLALSLAALFPDPKVVCLFALFFQVASLVMVRRSAADIYTVEGKATSTAGRLHRQIARDMQALRQPAILRLTFFSLLARMPLTIIFAMAVFYLHRAEPNLGNPTQLLSAILLVRALGSALLLEVVQRQLKAGVSEVGMAQWGFALMLLVAILAVFPLSLTCSIMAILAIGMVSYLCAPWQRANRQEVLRRHGGEASQAGVTGLMISIESSAYLLGATLAAACGNDMTLVLAFAAILAFIGTLGLLAETELMPRRLQSAPARVTTKPD